MSKHTPGPWLAQKYPDVKSWTVSAETAMNRWTSIASVKTGEANARLIAAAPELLAACRDAADWFDDAKIDTQKLRDMLYAAIAKAEGRP